MHFKAVSAGQLFLFVSGPKMECGSVSSGSLDDKGGDVFSEVTYAFVICEPFPPND